MNNQPIATNLHHIKDTLPGGVTLVAVSKFHPAEAIAEAYEAGQRVFGESRVQELTQKAPALPADISWHFIGHLQSNKVRQLLKLRPAMIESVDTERLLNIIDEEAAKEGIVQRLLLQLHVAKEETKFGFSPEELIDYFTQRKFETLKATHICGVMGMASNTDDCSRIVADFTLIADTFKCINEITPDLRGFGTLSMGMSHDYPIALECGATMVRVGSAIFGDRY
jgi:hypothetical protein